MPIRCHLGLATGILLLICGGLNLLSASADGPTRVGLYVQFEDGSIVTNCVELDQPAATGLDVLREAKLNLIFDVGSFLGTAVCKIGETGCNYPAQDCFCQCPGKPCQYWNYWYAEDGQWRISPLGASSRVVKSGDVEGWVWGDGQVPPPTELLAEDICRDPATTAASVKLERDRDLTPLRPHILDTRVPTQTLLEAESAIAIVTPRSEIPRPTQTAASTPSSLSNGTSRAVGSPSFAWVIAGLSGLGIVLLGMAYSLMRRRP